MRRKYTLKLGNKSPISSARIEVLERSIADELRASVLAFRQANFLKTEWNFGLEHILRSGLITLEYQEMTGIANPLGLAAWRADVVRGVEAGWACAVRGFHFASSDPKHIRRTVLARSAFHCTRSRHPRYSFGVYVCAHYGGVSSVWVAVGLTTPAGEEEEGEEQAGTHSGVPAATGMPVVKRKW